MFKKILSLTVIVSFFLTTLGPLPKAHADILNLPKPGTMINLSPAYQPVIIRGLTVHKDNPFLFDFIVDVGQDHMSGEPLKKEGEKLIKYFLASLAIPDKDFWVNLSPYEKNKIIPDALSQTDMGRDLLEQDYILKQMTASLIYPEKQLGKNFWDKVYAKAQEEYGTTQIPVNTFNKVWIMADRAEVFEHNQTAFVVDQHLKVMLEEDYLSLQKHNVDTPVMVSYNRDAINRVSTNNISSQMVREIILPELEKEVNTGKNFANLRQIFNSIILSSWYKRNLQQALLNQVYADKSNVNGINLNDPTIKQQIYDQYLKAYKKGVFNYIKEEVLSSPNASVGDPSRSITIPRKYFSGGILRTGVASNPAMIRDEAVLAKVDEQWDPLEIFNTGFNANNSILPAITAIADLKNKILGLPSDLNLNQAQISDLAMSVNKVIKNLLDDPHLKNAKPGTLQWEYKEQINSFSQRLLPYKFQFGINVVDTIFLVILTTYLFRTHNYNHISVGAFRDLLQIGERILGISFLFLTIYKIKNKDFEHLYVMTEEKDRIAQGLKNIVNQLKERNLLEPDLARRMQIELNLFTNSSNRQDTAMSTLIEPRGHSVFNLFENNTTKSERVHVRVPDLGDSTEFTVTEIEGGAWKISYAPSAAIVIQRNEGSRSIYIQKDHGNLISTVSPDGPSLQLLFTTPQGHDKAVKMLAINGIGHSVSISATDLSNVELIQTAIRQGVQVSGALTAEGLRALGFEPKDVVYSTTSNLKEIHRLLGRTDNVILQWDGGVVCPLVSTKTALEFIEKRKNQRLHIIFSKDLPEEKIYILYTDFAMKTNVNHMFEYRVREGDSWESVAEKFGMSPGLLALNNNKKTTDVLKAESIIRIVTNAKMFTYTVIRPNENIATVIQEFKIPLSQLIKVNPWLPNQKNIQLKVGQKIIINLDAAMAALDEQEVKRLEFWRNIEKRTDLPIFIYIGTKKMLGFLRSQHWLPETDLFIQDSSNGEVVRINKEILPEKLRTLEGQWALVVLENNLPNTSNKYYGAKLMYWGPTDKAALAHQWQRGGIDLNVSNGMRWKISKDGQGVEMNIDKAMIARIRREGIDSLSPVIFKITPIASIWPLVGLQAPVQSEHLALG